MVSYHSELWSPVQGTLSAQKLRLARSSKLRKAVVAPAVAAAAGRRQPPQPHVGMGCVAMLQCCVAAACLWLSG